MCELCGKPTGIELNIGELADKIPGFNPQHPNYQHGICAVCKSELDSGCTFFCDSKNRVVKVSLEATKEKISPEFHGRVVKIPVSALTELIRVWAAHQIKKMI